MDTRILHIAKRIRALRIEKGYTSHNFFAGEHKIPLVQYWRMEKGTNFTTRTFLRVL